MAFDINEDLHHKLIEAARLNGKSVKAEVADRLEASFFACEATAMLRTALRILKQRIAKRDEHISAQGNSLELLHKMQAIYASSIENLCQRLLHAEDAIGSVESEAAEGRRDDNALPGAADLDRRGAGEGNDDLTVTKETNSSKAEMVTISSNAALATPR